jgi:methionine synthase I (cobalamin-dependent)/5,10-methylenetetrahydrofolate reductase
VSRLLERLASGPPLVGDGGTGALLAGAVPRLRTPEEANLRARETVLGLHLAFIRAGAELIETNTFAANRRKLRKLYLEEELEALNTEGVRIAREARDVSGRQVFVAGSIGPLAELGEYEYGDLAADFAEQAALLDARGVDLLVLETFFDLDELETAIAAVRSCSSLPIVALLAFDEDGETLAGVPARAAAERLAGLGLAAVGANCGIGPQAALDALAELDGGVLAAKPNVGRAARVGGRIVYPQGTPDYFRDFAAHAFALGARLVGGCCGTTPAQIAAIRDALEQERRPAQPRAPVVRPLAVAEAAEERPTRLEEAFRRGDRVVSVELDPPRGANPEAMLAAARTLAEAGVGWVDVNDNPMARARMNALMASIRIERETGLETIPHVTPRDTSIMGLQSALLGAHAEGLRAILAVTGDPPAVGDYTESAGVYEVDSIGLCRILSRLNQGEDWNGRAIDAPTSFYVGVAVNPAADDVDGELRRFEQKLAAGARFAMTQSLFDLAYLDRFERLLGGWPIPVLLGVFYVTSHRLALHLHNEVPGIVVPEHLQERLRRAGAHAADEGRAIAHELIEQARDRVDGIYVIPPFKQPAAALELLRAISCGATPQRDRALAASPSRPGRAGGADASGERPSR